MVVSKPLLKVCADSVESAVAAERGGADRLELCMSLAEGGFTPSSGLIERVLSIVHIPVHVLIRPRTGNFCYSKEEMEVILSDVRQVKQLGADGIVVGMLTKARSVNVDQLKSIRKIAGSMSITFHRAFDFSRHPV